MERCMKKLEINLSNFQFAYVTIVIIFNPIISMIMILIKNISFQQIGAILLVGSMLGSFIFGVINHIIIPGSDNIFTVNNNLWGLLFQFTAILLATIMRDWTWNWVTQRGQVDLKV